jgi:hypothetical protein
MLIADYISRNYSGKVVEVGVGRRWDTAKELAEKGFEVIVVDVIDILPEGLRYIRDDITNPDSRVYQNASLIYSIRPPVELYPYIIEIARKVRADCIIRPLSNEFPDGGELVNYIGERFYLWRF